MTLREKLIDFLREWRCHSSLRMEGDDHPDVPRASDIDELEAIFRSEPISMLLPCPTCGKRHIDEGEFATKVHHTHSCQHCGNTWRPAIQPTVGVEFLPGYKNVPETPPPPYALNVWVVLQEGHRPYVSTVEHTPGYFDALKAQGAFVYQAEIPLPGFVIADGKVQGRSV